MTTTTIDGDFAELFGEMAEKLATVKHVVQLPGGGACKILGVEGAKKGAMYLVSGGMVAGVMSEDNARKARSEADGRMTKEQSDAVTAQLNCAEAELAQFRSRIVGLEHDRDVLRERTRSAETQLQATRRETMQLYDGWKERAERAEAECEALRSKFNARADETAKGLANGKVLTGYGYLPCGHDRQIMKGAIFPCSDPKCATAVPGAWMMWADGPYDRAAGPDGWTWVKQR